MEMTVSEPLTDDQFKQLHTERSSPVISRGGAAEYGKKEMAKLVYGGEGVILINNPSEGQMVMARMLAREKPDKSLEARAVGAVMVITGTGVRSGIASERDCYDDGATIFTGGIRIDGRLSFIAADKDGVFAVQSSTKDSDFGFKMRGVFDSVGRGSASEESDSSVNFRLNMAHPSNWEGAKIIRLVDGEDVKNALTLAAKESEKAPFITSKDAKTNPIPQMSQSGPPLKISEVVF